MGMGGNPGTLLEAISEAPPETVITDHAETLVSLLTHEAAPIRAESASEFRRVASALPGGVLRHSDLTAAGVRTAQEETEAAVGVAHLLEETPAVVLDRPEAVEAVGALLPVEETPLRRAGARALETVGRAQPSSLDAEDVAGLLELFPDEPRPDIRRSLATAVRSATEADPPSPAGVDTLHDPLSLALVEESVEGIRRKLAAALRATVEAAPAAVPVDDDALDRYASALETAASQGEQERLAAAASEIAVENASQSVEHTTLATAVLETYRTGSVSVRTELCDALDVVTRAALIGVASPGKWPTTLVEPLLTDLLELRQRPHSTVPEWRLRRDLAEWACNFLLAAAEQDLDAILSRVPLSDLDVEVVGVLGSLGVDGGDAGELDATVGALLTATLSDALPAERTTGAVETLLRVAHDRPETCVPAVPWVVQVLIQNSALDRESALLKVLASVIDNVDGDDTITAVVTNAVDAVAEGTDAQRERGVDLVLFLTDHTDDLGDVLAAPVEPLLAGSPAQRQRALGVLSELAAEDPALVRPLVPTVVDILFGEESERRSHRTDDDTARETLQGSTDSEAQREAAGVLQLLADRAPSVLFPQLDRLTAALPDLSADAAELVATCLATVGSARPELLSAETVRLLAHEHGTAADRLAEDLCKSSGSAPETRTAAMEQLAVLTLGKGYPGVVLGNLETLLAPLRERSDPVAIYDFENPRFEYALAVVLKELSTVAPGAVATRTSLLRSLVENAAAPETRIVACEIVRTLAPKRPDAVAELTDALLVTARTADGAERSLEDLGPLALDRVVEDLPNHSRMDGGDSDDTADESHSSVANAPDTEGAPVSVDDRVAVSELYEAFRVFALTLDAATDPAEDTLQRQYVDAVKQRRDEYGDRQQRIDHSMADYRARFSDGTGLGSDDLRAVAVTSLPETVTTKFNGGVRPVSPVSETPLPVRVRSETDLSKARDLVSEFPDEPAITPDETDTAPAADMTPTTSHSGTDAVLRRSAMRALATSTGETDSGPSLNVAELEHLLSAAGAAVRRDALAVLAEVAHSHRDAVADLRPQFEALLNDEPAVSVRALDVLARAGSTATPLGMELPEVDDEHPAGTQSDPKPDGDNNGDDNDDRGSTPQEADAPTDQEDGLIVEAASADIDDSTDSDNNRDNERPGDSNSDSESSADGDSSHPVSMERSAVSERYELLRLFRDAIMSAIGRGIGDDEVMRTYLENVKEAVSGAGSQQADTVEHTMDDYRAVFGDGDRVTDFASVPAVAVRESDRIRYRDHDANPATLPNVVPAAPDSSDALPVVVTSSLERERAEALLTAFVES